MEGITEAQESILNVLMKEFPVNKIVSAGDKKYLELVFNNQCLLISQDEEVNISVSYVPENRIFDIKELDSFMKYPLNIKDKNILNEIMKFKSKWARDPLAKMRKEAVKCHSVSEKKEFVILVKYNFLLENNWTLQACQRVFPATGNTKNIYDPLWMVYLIDFKNNFYYLGNEILNTELLSIFDIAKNIPKDTIIIPESDELLSYGKRASMRL